MVAYVLLFSVEIAFAGFIGTRFAEEVEMLRGVWAMSQDVHAASGLILWCSKIVVHNSPPSNGASGASCRDNTESSEAQGELIHATLCRS